MTIPLLRLGSSGPHVHDLQTAFNAALFSSLNLIIGTPRGGLWDRQWQGFDLTGTLVHYRDP